LPKGYRGGPGARGAAMGVSNPPHFPTQCCPLALDPHPTSCPILLPVPRSLPPWSLPAHHEHPRSSAVPPLLHPLGIECSLAPRHPTFVPTDHALLPLPENCHPNPLLSEPPFPLFLSLLTLGDVGDLHRVKSWLPLPLQGHISPFCRRGNRLREVRQGHHP